jgi:aerobic carbon-monoxide dehydrogenase large subunit
LSGSLLDYALPTAGDVPVMTIVHQHSPSPLNPLGVKGVGEGGAVAPPAAVANAVCDALAPFGVEVNATPIRPEQLLRALRQAEIARLALAGAGAPRFAA